MLSLPTLEVSQSPPRHCEIKIDDEIRPFGHGHERVRGRYPAVGMVPAGQGLQPDDLVRAEIDDRLIPRGYIPGADGLGDIIGRLIVGIGHIRTEHPAGADAAAGR